MNPPATPAEPSSVTARLRRARLTLRLWRQDRHRRDVLTLFWLQLASLAGWRTVLAFLAAGGLLAAGLSLAAPPPEVLHGAVQLLLCAGALAAGAGLFAEDIRHGTFDLLWLGTGSRGRMMRLRAGALLIVLSALALGAGILLAWHTRGGGAGAPGGGVLAHALPLLASATLVLSLSAWLRTWLPQALPAAIAAAALTTALYLATRGSASAFAPFLAPAGAGMATLILNAILLGLTALIFLSSAANRLDRLGR